MVGALAVSARTEPRFTRDVDLVVAVQSDAEAEVDLLALLRVAAPADLEVARAAGRG